MRRRGWVWKSQEVSKLSQSVFEILYSVSSQSVTRLNQLLDSQSTSNGKPAYLFQVEIETLDLWLARML